MKWFAHIAWLSFMMQGSFVFAQNHPDKVNVSFEFCYGDLKIPDLSNELWVNAEDSISIEACRFYVSNLKLLQGEILVWQEQDLYHLIDASVTSSLHFDLDVPSNLLFNQLSFDLGIDSLTNVQGALGGNLDPTQGMYWAWQSGYINFKLEGKKILSDALSQDFQFHLGGYHFPFNACRQILLPADDRSIKMKVNLQRLIESVDMKTHHHIMSPCYEAMQISDKVVHIFSMK